jgi:hypothetical protein
VHEIEGRQKEFASKDRQGHADYMPVHNIILWHTFPDGSDHIFVESGDRRYIF